MYYIVCIVSLLFGILSMIAALSQYRKAKNPTPHLLMMLGGMVLLFAIIAAVNGFSYDWVFALVGCSLICGAAIYNGKSGGNFHLSHHIVRIALSVFLVAGFLFG